MCYIWNLLVYQIINNLQSIRKVKYTFKRNTKSGGWILFIVALCHLEHEAFGAGGEGWTHGHHHKSALSSSHGLPEPLAAGIARAFIQFTTHVLPSRSWSFLLERVSRP
jgi:hypothetical protein